MRAASSHPWQHAIECRTKAAWPTCVSQPQLHDRWVHRTAAAGQHALDGDRPVLGQVGEEVARGVARRRRRCGACPALPRLERGPSGRPARGWRSRAAALATRPCCSRRRCCGVAGRGGFRAARPAAAIARTPAGAAAACRCSRCRRRRRRLALGHGFGCRLCCTLRLLQRTPIRFAHGGFAGRLAAGRRISAARGRWVRCCLRRWLLWGLLWWLLLLLGCCWHGPRRGRRGWLCCGCIGRRRCTGAGRAVRACRGRRGRLASAARRRRRRSGRDSLACTRPEAGCCGARCNALCNAGRWQVGAGRWVLAGGRWQVGVASQDTHRLLRCWRTALLQMAPVCPRRQPCMAVQARMSCVPGCCTTPGGAAGRAQGHAGRSRSTRIEPHAGSRSRTWRRERASMLPAARQHCNYHERAVTRLGGAVRARRRMIDSGWRSPCSGGGCQPGIIGSMHPPAGVSPGRTAG